MTAKEIRQAFLDFFQNKGHQIAPSAPIVVKNDPTLMFTNAGMNQFKDYFLGNKPIEIPRIANSQKCLRVSGKHNDLEEVGIDTYHHTMFEMLGNWSFGDYFKKEAIDWAWELLTEVYKLPKDRLYATVFEGDASENLEFDSEAHQLWQQYLPTDRILNGSKKDNFWEMGDTGPCGPCTEIHIDLRPDSEREKTPGAQFVNHDNPLVIEIWNLVFMQFNRMADKSLVSLPAKHVDTGMGFERLAMAVQGKKSNYDSDVFQPSISHLAAKAKTEYGKDTKTDVAIRVIADHIRAIAFAIADGQLPSNNKAGYVIRRILRRAVRYGYTFLGFKEPFMHELVPILGGQFNEIFPELEQQKDFIAKVIFEEESSFLRTLDNGLRLFEQIKEHLKGTEVPGQQVFELYDTFGFPVDLTALIARENGLTIDFDGFHAAMEEQKTRSRAAAATEKGDWILVAEGHETEFLGYETLECAAKILRYREMTEKNKKFYQVVLDKTPFYAEGGGQAGDQGYLQAGAEKTSVKDTKKENDLIIHILDKLPAKLDADFNCVVNAQKRALTENNHSATHLLHAALKLVLGNHVNQKGSLVNENLLRFDFSHFAKITDEEIAKIEKIVNEKIRLNLALEERRNVPVQEAMGMGAMALFGEKYGDFVRVITFGKGYSTELCGGTHVKAVGQIGLFKIVSESAVAAGVRRLEAITSEKAEAHIQGELALLQDVKELFKLPQDLKRAVTDLLEDKAALQKEVERLQNKELQALKSELILKMVDKGGVSFIAEKVQLPSVEGLRQLSFDLRGKVDNLFLVLAAEIDDKPQIGIMISDNLVASKGYDAGKMIRELAKNIQGGGGGQPFFATAGGKDLSGLDKVLAQAEKML